MTNSQRKAILVLGILLGLLLASYGFGQESFLIMFGGPIVSIGIGVYFWLGRSKGPADDEPPPS